MKAATLFFVFFVGICAGEVCYECNEVNRDVFAGQSILMGHFTYTYNGNFSIEAITDGDWVYKTIHLHIGTTEPPLGPGGNPRPGHFPFVYENIYTKNFVGSFNIDIECGSTVYIAFHAEAIEVISGAVISSETAWAYGNERFPGSRWGWYSSYDTCCNSVSCEENPPNLGEIGDQVWWDDNRDGVMNPDEQGLSGVRVSLFLCNGGSDQYAETTTDEAGGYLFSDLPAGCYNVLVSNWNGENLLADGYNFSIITTDSIFTVDLAANESFRDADFGFDTNNCPCSSADPCVLYSSCDAGECVFEQMECHDGIECTSDSCVDGACVFAPVDVECDDGVPCTLDVCEPSTGCSHTTIDEICKDDVSCTIDFCDAEGCHHTPDSSACDDNVSCTSDYCDDIHGCVNTRIDVACDDNNLCTDDSCEATGCVNVAISCDDGIACTVDTCDPLVGCIHTPDDSVCTLDVECNIGHCDETEGCIFESINCNDQIDCTFDSCDEQGNCVHTAVNSFCDDEIACTFDTCDPETGCRHTTRDNMCNDEVDCTNDLCDEELGCVHTPVNSSCDDGISCTDDICNEFGGCANSPMDSSCDDEVSCTIDRCDTEQGCVNTPDDSSCEDYDACTMGSCDAVEGCQYQVVSCDDQVDCTIDWCDSEEGCFHDSDDNACNDSDACTVDVCDSFTGCSHSAISCDDGVACTVDSCDPATGCTHSPMDSNCDDNNPCTIDTCTATGCTHSADPSCTPPPSICEVQPFQGATPYNLFSLGSIDACNSDVEGRVAANGAITLDHYSVGLKNAVNGLYSLVSSSVINFSRGTVWYGNVISSENNFVDVAIMVNGTTENANTCCADLACSACLSTADASLPVDFETTESDLLELSLYWQSLPNTPSATVEYLYQSVTLTCASGESFNHFVDVDLDSITSMEINCPAGSVVLIDYSSNSDGMGNMGLSLTGGVSRDSVIHHFTSESLTISGVHVIGSVFAPFSDLYFPQGLITGQVIVGSVVSGEAGCSEGQININSFVGCLPIPQ